MQFSEITISYKPLIKRNLTNKISSSLDIFSVLKTLWSEHIYYKEEFHILLLNSNNVIIGISKISEGGLSGTAVDPKMIFQCALKANASAIVLAHNHPSGNLKASNADIAITKRLVQVGLFLDLPIFDHLILTADNYLSFAEEGLL